MGRSVEALQIHCLPWRFASRGLEGNDNVALLKVVHMQGVDAGQPDFASSSISRAKIKRGNLVLDDNSIKEGVMQWKFFSHSLRLHALFSRLQSSRFKTSGFSVAKLDRGQFDGAVSESGSGR